MFLGDLHNYNISARAKDLMRKDRLLAVYQNIPILKITNCTRDFYTNFLQPHLGEFPERLFTDKAAEDAISRFQGKLHKISKAIEHRNDKLEFPYTYLLPENTPNSVAI